VPVHFPLLPLGFIDGNSVVHSWDPIAMNELITRLDKFFEQLVKFEKLG